MEYCPAKFLMGNLYYSQKLYKLAYQNYQEASKGTCYSEPAPHFKQALTLEKLGKLKEAQKKFLFLHEKFPATHFGNLAKQRSLQKKDISFLKNSELFQSEGEKEELKAFKQFESFKNQKDTEIMTTSPRF